MIYYPTQYQNSSTPPVRRLDIAKEKNDSDHVRPLIHMIYCHREMVAGEGVSSHIQGRRAFILHREAFGRIDSQPEAFRAFYSTLPCSPQSSPPHLPKNCADSSRAIKRIIQHELDESDTECFSCSKLY